MVDAARLRWVDHLWAPRCLVCEERGADGRDLCLACADALPWDRDASPHCAGHAGHPLCAVHAAFVYGFPLDRLVPRLKFHADLAAGRLLAQLCGDAFAHLPRPDALLPLPLHRARLRQRGYDQALELARPIAQRLHLPLLHDGLVRVRATQAQSTLHARERLHNVRGAFAVVDAARLPRHVVLVDDVMTTGATLQAAAQALREAGVARVDAWVCARVD